MARVGFTGLGSTEGKKTSFSLLDPGWYDGKITECEYRESKEKKTPFLNYCVEITQGPPQKDGTECMGRKAYGTIWLPKDDDPADKWERKNQNLKAFLEVTETELDGDDFDTDKIVGGKLAIKIKHTTDQKGEQRAEIADFNPEGSY